MGDHTDLLKLLKVVHGKSRVVQGLCQSLRRTTHRQEVTSCLPYTEWRTRLILTVFVVFLKIIFRASELPGLPQGSPDTSGSQISDSSLPLGESW